MGSYPIVNSKPAWQLYASGNFMNEQAALEDGEYEYSSDLNVLPAALGRRACCRRCGPLWHGYESLMSVAGAPWPVT